MKRLKSYLLKMDNNETTYKEIYDGAAIIPPKADVGMPTGNPTEFIKKVNDPVYWSGETSYQFTQTHKLAKDKPTVVVMIPLRNLIKGEDNLKRLEGILCDCYYKHKSWAELYNGTCAPHRPARPIS